MLLLYPTVDTVTHNKGISHYDEMLFNRLRIGHSHLTYSYLLHSNDQPTCEPCGVPLTVKNMLVECPNLQNACKKYYSVSSLRDLFVSINNQNIIDFIKETHFTTTCNVCYFTSYISSIALILRQSYYRTSGSAH